MIVRHIGKVEYRLDLSVELTVVHPVFYVSILKKCVGDPFLAVSLESIGFKDSLTYEKLPVDILD